MSCIAMLPAISTHWMEGEGGEGCMANSFRKALDMDGVLQEALINNLALKWEDAEEARLKAGQEDMQHRNPEPVKPSRPGRFSDLFRKAKPSAPAQAIDTCADLLQIPKVSIFLKV